MSERTYNIILVILIVIACIVTGALLYLIYDSTLAPEPTPTPTPTVSQPVIPEDAWARIQAAGKMTVGTSADYPPFAYWTADYKLDGLDVALISEIGDVLGIDVAIKDMAFDGLNWALELGQIDVIIAALSVTPERSASLDFTDIYFVSEDAILTRINSGLPPVTRVTELAPYRIGVQRASVFSNWIHEELIDPGLMPASQLSEYEEIELAVRDLREDRLDVVVLDFPPAQAAISQGGVRLIGQGLNTQYYAIGIPKGETALQQQLNDAIKQLYESGRLAELTQIYMGVSVPLPPPAPTPGPDEPTPTPVPSATPAPCVDGMTYVADLNLDDNGMQSPPNMPPGQPFRKGWRIRNTGTCTWDSNYRLTYDGGNSPASSMSGQPTPIVGTVPPNTEYDIFVDLVAPAVPGVYQAFWVMRNSQDRKFGDRIWVGIEVPRPPTVTPPPTQTPAPGIRFTVDRNRIFAGECVTFRWSVTGAQAVYFYSQGQPWQQHQVPPQASRVECPPVTTTFELRVNKLDSTVEVRQITIYVEPIPGAPVIERFTVDPQQILEGQCVDITWAVSGDVTGITLRRGNVDLWPGGAPVSGTLQDCPPNPGSVNYIIEATGPGGTSRLQRNVLVNERSTPTVTSTPVPPQVTDTPVPPQVTDTPVPPPSTPTPIPPVIYAFSAAPTEIETGGCVNVTWQVGGDAAQIDLLRDGVIVVPNAPYSGVIQDCLMSAGTYTYQLVVLGRNGDTITQDQSISVSEASSSLPLQNTSWSLMSYFDGVGASRNVLSSTSITAIFGEDGQLNGSADCSTYAANYTEDGSSISIGVPSVTQLCEETTGITEQESDYISVLPMATSYEISSSFLTISDASGRVILQYTAEGGQ